MTNDFLKKFFNSNDQAGGRAAFQQKVNQMKQMKSSQNASSAQLSQLAQNLASGPMRSIPGAGIGIASPSLGFMGELEPEEPVETSIKAKEVPIHKTREMLLKILQTSIVPFLWGPPGVGKSSVVRDICKEQNWKMVDLRLSLLNPVDLRGLPVINKETREVDWFPPKFLPRYDDSEVGVLFLDEINLAPLATQSAAYQLILDKRVGEYQFPPHWKIIAAGNRETDRANVYKISAPLANRFIHLEVIPSFEGWKQWAIANNIRNEIIQFLIIHRDYIFKMPADSQQRGFPSPRTWEFLSQLLNAFDYNEGDVVNEQLQQMIIGTIGEPEGRTFVRHLGSHKIQKVASMVEDFLATGKLTLPKVASMRFAITRSIYDAHKEQKVKPEFYESFLQKLTKEEQKAIAEFDAEKGDELRDYQNNLQPKAGKFTTTLARDLDREGQIMVVMDTSGFATNGFAIIFNDKKNEVVEYDHLGTNVVNIVRGTNGTMPLSWPSGVTRVQPI